MAAPNFPVGLVNLELILIGTRAPYFFNGLRQHPASFLLISAP